MKKTRKIKSASRDFTANDLPANRRALFWDCYREQFSLMIKLGLICMVAFLPFLAVTILKDGALYQLSQAGEALTAEEAEAALQTTKLLYGAAEVVATVLLFLGLSGCCGALRQVLWQEPVFLWEDWKAGVKGNARRFCAVAFLLALPMYVTGCYLSDTVGNLLRGALAVTILPLGGWMLAQTVYYDLRFGDSLKNAVVFYIKAWPGSVALVLAALVPLYLLQNAIAWLMVKYVAMLAVAILYVIALTMAAMAFAGGYFDAYINKEHYPQIYRKGLRAEEKEREQ